MTRLINTLCLIILLIGSGYTLPAQPPDSLQTNRLLPLAIGAGIAYGGTMYYLSNQWYSEFEKESFHFFDDSKEWKQIDKAGHIMGSYQLQNTTFHALRWTGLSRKQSLLWSGISSMVFMTSIEVLDGHSAEYGASASDAIANVAGIGIFTLQQIGWKEVRIHPKLSFQQSPYASQRPETLGNGWYEEVLKDYNGHTFWLSVDISAFTESKFPKWLNVAVGYGAEEMIYARDHQNEEVGLSPYRQWYIGPDLDLSQVRSKSKFVNTLLFAVNMIRIPAPALEYNSSGWSWHWLK